MNKSHFDTSEYKVTYLLGAGASANALPTVKATDSSMGLADRLLKLSESLVNAEGAKEIEAPKLMAIQKDLQWLGSNSKKFGTPDTFAKYLHLKERSSISVLKKTLGFYFLYEQFITKKSDIRALIFLTSVMQFDEVFPTNIKILNWNYDSQIQIAANNFRTESYVKSHSTFAHKPPLISYYPSLGHPKTVNNDEIQMVHLNGIAGHYYDESQGIYASHIHNKSIESLGDLINRVYSTSGAKIDLQKFAFEQPLPENHNVEVAKQIIADSDILVVIGYSFPFFNRQVDSEIFNVLKSSGKFKKIYFQDPYRDGRFLKSQFSLSNGIDIEHYSGTENYFIPLEL